MHENNRKPNCKCIICGKPVYKRPSQIQVNQRKVYCSVKCYGISCRKEKPCLICGKPILAGLNKKTCSRECSNKLRLGTHYHQGPIKDKVKNYRILKKRLAALRGSKCEKCGYNKFEIVQVHHKNRNRENNNLNNLELLCPNCHYEEHILKSQMEGGQDGNARVLKTRGSNP